MAVDEFGREIPAARGGRRSPSPRRHPEGGNLPSHLYDSLPTSRYNESTNVDNDASADHHRSSSRKRKHRSLSPQPGSRRDNHHNNYHSSSKGGAPASTNNNSSAKAHPSAMYVEEPMLCHYLWKEANKGKTEEEYDEYRKSYCLNYVRTFFNEHMDDSWFRSLYSPLARYEVGHQENARACKEAEDFAQELDSSLAKTSNANNDPSFFVLKARLGSGIRQKAGADYHTETKRGGLVNPVPATHVFTMTQKVLPILEVPHYVTDEQLTTAIMQQLSSKTTKEVMDPASSLELLLYSGNPSSDLTRNAYLIADEAVRKEVIQALNYSDRPAAPNSSNNAHVPRKEDTFLPKTLELVVECSDAYGRLEVDADGKGGEPEERGGVPPRKASVWVSTRPLVPRVQVLSPALSSTQRIAQDQQASLQIASALDAKKQIPTACRLETLLPKAIPSIAQEEKQPQALEDALDVTIAYLRRVHLVSYYNGCQSASKIAEVLDGNHACSTIHLRLANADELLAEKSGEATAEGASPPPTDLLVQRLNDSIQAALDMAEAWKASNKDEGGDDGLPATCIVIDPTVDKQAKEIRFQESQVEGPWIDDHALIDEDGRARCAFHFCRKLFKDSSFLKKHLIKKHSEFLKAEIAKCHDSYMMTTWDAQEARPVPPILVDCGHRFGLKPSPVIGAAEPVAEDPEPELWKREEERREYEESRRQQQQHYNDGPMLDGPLSEGRGRSNSHAKSHFEDVDDVKVEKVEIAFDKIEIPVVQPPKKKKKKKKLL